MLLFSAVCSVHCSGCTQTFYLDTRESHDKVHCKSDQYLAFGYIELFRRGIFWIYSAFYPLGTLWLDFAKHWKRAQLFGHWVHWSQMAGHIQNVLSMYPLGISGSHNRAYLKCTQHLITGHIRVACWLWSQCFHYVPSGYLGPCPQWQLPSTLVYCTLLIVLRSRSRIPLRRIRSLVYISPVLVATNLRTNITCLSLYLSEVPSERSETPVRLWLS